MTVVSNKPLQAHLPEGGRFNRWRLLFEFDHIRVTPYAYRNNLKDGEIVLRNS